MTFSDKTGTAFESFPGERYWISDDQKCDIELLDRGARMGLGKSEYTVWIRVRIRDHRMQDVSCAKDGVVAFVVKEIMNLEEEYGYDYGGLVRQIGHLFDVLKPRATLYRFNAYKAGLWSSV